MDGLKVWRHLKPCGVEGLCIGRLDVAVDARRSKRLAHRIRAWARQQNAPRIVVTSPLARTADVGRWLSRWGWRHEIDARLSELDFGAWQGRAWQAIGQDEVDRWCRDFGRHRPGGGESTDALLARCRAFLSERRETPAVCIVAHAGWISAAQWLRIDRAGSPNAEQWPAAIRYGESIRIGA
jgi:alpha-ribazole phosphatase